MNYSFSKLLNDLKDGREIEFDYNGNTYSIVNGNGKWFLCEKKKSIELCNFEEVDILQEKIRHIKIQDKSIEDIINKKLYVKDTLYIL